LFPLRRSNASQSDDDPLYVGGVLGDRSHRCGPGPRSGSASPRATGFGTGPTESQRACIASAGSQSFRSGKRFRLRRHPGSRSLPNPTDAGDPGCDVTGPAPRSDAEVQGSATVGAGQLARGGSPQRCTVRGWFLEPQLSVSIAGGRRGSGTSGPITARTDSAFARAHRRRAGSRPATAKVANVARYAGTVPNGHVERGRAGRRVARARRSVACSRESATSAPAIAGFTESLLSCSAGRSTS